MDNLNNLDETLDNFDYSKSTFYNFVGAVGCVFQTFFVMDILLGIFVMLDLTTYSISEFNPEA